MSEELAEIYSELREVRRALFGDMLRQETGLVKQVDGVMRVVEGLERTQGDLARMVPLVEELKRSDDERRLERRHVERNWLSREAGEVVRILAVILMTWPVMAWDWRALWGGVGRWAPVGALVGLLAFFAVISIVARRNGHHG